MKFQCWNLIYKLDSNFDISRTVEFGEFQSWGTGSDTSGRVPWSKKLTYEEAKPFMDIKFIDGKQWLKL